MDRSNSNKLVELLRETREHAKFLGELGVEFVSLPARVEGEASTNVRSAGDVPKSKVAAESPRPLFARLDSKLPDAMPRSAPSEPPRDALFEMAASQPAFPQASETLEDIWRDIGDCARCGLCEGRTQVVNTHGNHGARLMFVGEAPGADEDAQGKPFVGRAGQLLTKMIEAMGMKREEVIIGNVNRCRPPGNRQPTLEEAAICRPFLFREIGVIQPEVIVVMGNTALRNLLEVREGISRVRGKFQDFRGIKVMPTFHPAYLLRDPSKKRETWEDLKMVRDYLENTTPKTDS